jgi:Cu/Ag efflux protein CusF
MMSYSDRAEAAIKAFSSRLQQAAIAMPQMCVAAWLKSKTPLRQVKEGPQVSLICVAKGAADTQWVHWT